MVEPLTPEQKRVLSRIPAFRRQIQEQELLRRGDIRGLIEFRKRARGFETLAEQEAEVERLKTLKRRRGQLEEAERKRLAQLNIQIGKERAEELKLANQRFRDAIKRAVGVQGRLQAQRNLLEDRSIANARALAKRVEAGLSPGGVSPSLIGGEAFRVTPKTAKEFLKKTEVEKEKIPTVVTEVKKFTPEEKAEARRIERRRKFAKVKEVVKEKIKFLREGIPEEEDVFPLLEKKPFKTKPDIPVAPPGFILEKADIDVPTGTEIVFLTAREKNFFENLGINPNDKSSIKLKTEVENIQRSFDQEVITEEEANKKLEEASNKFQKAQIRKGIPKSLAFGGAFGLISAVPVVGQIAGGLLLADILLKRKRFIEQFKKFPVESALTTGSFLAGGLATSSIVAGVRGGAKPQLNLENIESVTKVSGASKTSLVKKAQEFEFFSAEQQKGKVTDTLAYDIVLKDGTRYKVLEYTKLDKPSVEGGIKGTKEFIGFEVNPKIKGVKILKGVVQEKPTVLIGRGVVAVKPKTTAEFLRIIKFTPSPTRTGRLAQRVFGSGRVFDIVSRSRQVGVKGRFQKLTRVESEARLLAVTRLSGQVLRQVARAEKKIAKGKKPSLSEIRNIINLDRRLAGQEPFTKAEFNKAGFRTLADISTVTLFNLFRRTKQRARLRASEKIILKERLAGRIITKPAPEPTIKPPKRIPKREEATISDVRSRLIKMAKETGDKSKTQNLLQKQQLQKAMNRLKNIPSTAVTLAVSLVKKQKTTSAKQSVSNAVSSLSASASLQALNQIENQLVLQAQQQRALIIQATPSLSNQREEQLQKLRQGLAQRLRQIQIQKQKVVQRGRQARGKRITPAPKIPKLRIPPPKLPSGFKGFRKPAVAPRKQIGYNILFKRRGKFRKVNKKPLPKLWAKSLGAFVTDRSLGASWKLKKAKKPAVNKTSFNFPKNYFERTQFKFRPSKKLKGVFVEKRKHRLDTRSEVKRIHQDKFLAQIRKKKVPKAKLKSTKQIKFKRRKK